MRRPSRLSGTGGKAPPSRPIHSLDSVSAGSSVVFSRAGVWAARERLSFPGGGISRGIAENVTERMGRESSATRQASEEASFAGKRERAKTGKGHDRLIRKPGNQESALSWFPGFLNHRRITLFRASRKMLRPLRRAAGIPALGRVRLDDVAGGGADTDTG